ncbi:MAG: 8-oxoguanine DNA glycosylase [Clostridia bacterium]|nr:8-oxoguanine DNA glycosylase [Clostridia bacterium]
MEKIVFNSEYFNARDTLLCGQLFRYFPVSEKANAYFVNSADKRCLVYNDAENAVIECEEKDVAYFTNYFDLSRDYGAIVGAATAQGGVLKTAAALGKGIRILNQDKAEALFSFIVSQNNNIPRIKGIIERLCAGAGCKREFLGEEYYTFPTANELAAKPLEFFKDIGLGYRAEYIKRLADGFNATFNEAEFSALKTADLKKRLNAIYGVGPKVADCVSLFGFHRSDSFPVDTWIEKVYRENFGGTLTERNKIADYFVGRFGENSGYFQQYLFYYKRSLEKESK